jgi:hypothetical protein
MVGCVRGGGTVVAVFRGGRVALVASTAPGHHANRIRRGQALRDLRRRYPRLRRLSGDLYRPYKRSRIVLRVRKGRVTTIAVAAPALGRSPKTLRTLLVRALR